MALNAQNHSWMTRAISEDSRPKYSGFPAMLTKGVDEIGQSICFKHSRDGQLYHLS